MHGRSEFEDDADGMPRRLPRPTPRPPADATPAADEASLRERVAKLEQQNDEFLRHLAEFQNRNNEMLQVMRRKDQELEGRLKYAHEKLSRSTCCRPWTTWTGRWTRRRRPATRAR